DRAAEIVRLRDAGLDVRPGRQEVWLDATVIPAQPDRTPRGEVDDVVGAVGSRHADPATVRARGPVVLAAADGDDVLGGRRAGHGARKRTGVAGGEPDDHLLHPRHADLGVPDDLIVGLREGVVLPAVVETPGVARDARAVGVGAVLPLAHGKTAEPERDG